MDQPAARSRFPSKLGFCQTRHVPRERGARSWESALPRQWVSTSASIHFAEPQPIEQPESEPDLCFEPCPKTDFVPLNFDDPKAAYQSKSSVDLLRNLAVLSACQFEPLVNNADKLLKAATIFPGTTLTYWVVKQTFFRHFCAGEDEGSIRPSLKKLHASGIGAILDYAAEDDSDGGAASRSEETGSVVARTYDYETEEACDKHRDIFLRSIMAAADAPGQGFAAIKVTALGNPKLLERVSTTLSELHRLFERFDTDDSGFITKDKFFKVYEQLFVDANPERMEEVFNQLDTNHNGHVDYIGWTKRVSIGDVPRIVQSCKHKGPLAQSALSDEELELFDAMMSRLFKCAEVADKAGVRLMIDAEHSYFQAAINHAARQLSKRYNKTSPTIYQTYQCYLQDSYDRVCRDMTRAKQDGYIFAAKLVRGAYMSLERQRATDKHYESPIWEDKPHTDANYDRCVDEVIRHHHETGAEVMIATHNQQSVEHAVGLMHQLDLDPQKTGVFFGQLLGMSDPLTFVLGENGYKAYKYVPFGPIGETMPYLIRRAQENGAVLEGLKKEKALMRTELWRRFKEESFMSGLFGGSKQKQA
ncbi:hypothetical protein WJX73_003308 [Symbiochloris irregularis]|uniref:Proline dehydrogenase n=1 Tax=Symbiochloris irregularis TaxID=706552 RepID=A0AAW1NXX9_9CHLO